MGGFIVVNGDSFRMTNRSWHDNFPYICGGSILNLMFLIFDAGSTKTDVRLVKEDGTYLSAELAGINPFFMDADAIREELRRSCGMCVPSAVDSVYYYGAGCVADYEPLFVEILSSLFPKSRVEAHSDLFAACRATLGDEAGIACIMGTGSNSCYYDGSVVVSNVPPLGYVLGDEGSGATMGRQLVGDVLKGCAPVGVCERFWKWYGADRKTIMDGVYRGSFPNRFLATFSRFLAENVELPYCKSVVEKSFVAFFERNVLQYPTDVRDMGFVGSIASHFSDILREVAGRYGYVVRTIEGRPMDALAAYHKGKSFPA